MDSYLIYLIAFVIFVAAAYRPVGRSIIQKLDDHAATVKSRIQEAKDLRQQAQERLSFYEVQQRDSSKQTEALMADARKEAEILQQQTKDFIAQEEKRYKQQLANKLATMEANAIEEYRQMVITYATRATEELLQRYKTDQSNILQHVEKALKQFPA